MSFFGTSPRAQPEGECLKNHRFECEVRSLLFAAESKKQGQKGPFLTSPDASKNTVFETPWQKRFLVRDSVVLGTQIVIQLHFRSHSLSFNRFSWLITISFITTTDKGLHRQGK